MRGNKPSNKGKFVECENCKFYDKAKEGYARCELSHREIRQHTTSNNCNLLLFKKEPSSSSIPSWNWGDVATKETELEKLQATQIAKLIDLGVIASEVNHTRTKNAGTSNYSKFLLQPWAIWKEYGLNPWDADIIKRTLRTKEGDARKLDYEKIIHICQERISQLEKVK